MWASHLGSSSHWRENFLQAPFFSFPQPLAQLQAPRDHVGSNLQGWRQTLCPWAFPAELQPRHPFLMAPGGGGSASFPGSDLSAAQCRQSSPSALCCSPLAPQGLFPQWGDHPRRGCCHGPLHGEVGRAPFICGGQNTSPVHPLLLPTARCFGVSVLVSQPCCTQGSPGIPDSMGEARGCVQMLLCTSYWVKHQWQLPAPGVLLWALLIIHFTIWTAFPGQDYARPTRNMGCCCRGHGCHSFLQQYNRDRDWEAAF